MLGLLLDELYIYSENPLNGLRRLFEARSTCDYEGGPPCNAIRSQAGLFLTQADWTVDTFVRYLVQRNPDVAAAIRRAGPLLYQILVHYGSFPFPVDEDKRMTCGSFLRGIYMLSKNNHRVLSHQISRWQGGEPVTRAREPADDTRILFQSIATGNPRTFQNPGHRSEDDDEDLIDVLFRLGETIRERRSPKYGFKRKDVMVATSKIITVEQLAQLFLIMCSGYGLAPDIQAITVQFQPGSTNFQADMRHIPNIATLLQTPDHLLIVQAEEDISEAAYQSTTFCVYTGALEELQIHDLDRPRVRFRRPGEKYSIFGLSPVHHVFQKGINDPKDTLEVLTEQDGVRITTGALSLTFNDSLRHLEINGGSMAFEGKVTALEIWNVGYEG